MEGGAIAMEKIPEETLIDKERRKAKLELASIQERCNFLEREWKKQQKKQGKESAYEYLRGVGIEPEPEKKRRRRTSTKQQELTNEATAAPSVSPPAHKEKRSRTLKSGSKLADESAGRFRQLPKDKVSDPISCSGESVDNLMQDVKVAEGEEVILGHADEELVQDAQKAADAALSADVSLPTDVLPSVHVPPPAQGDQEAFEEIIEGMLKKEKHVEKEKKHRKDKKNSGLNEQFRRVDLSDTEASEIKDSDL